MPSWDIFENQTRKYRNSVLPPDVGARIAMEQASTFGWERYVGASGRIIGMETFGASAPLKELQKKFGFEPDRVVLVSEGTAWQGVNHECTPMFWQLRQTVDEPHLMIALAGAIRSAPRLPGGVNFSIFSRGASSMELLLFDRVDDETPARVIPIDPRKTALTTIGTCLYPACSRARSMAFEFTDHSIPRAVFVLTRPRSCLTPMAAPSWFRKTTAATPAVPRVTTHRRP